MANPLLDLEGSPWIPELVDDDGRRMDVEEGYVGTDMAREPVDRWWRG